MCLMSPFWAWRVFIALREAWMKSVLLVNLLGRSFVGCTQRNSAFETWSSLIELLTPLHSAASAFAMLVGEQERRRQLHVENVDGVGLYTANTLRLTLRCSTVGNCLLISILSFFSVPQFISSILLTSAHRRCSR